MTTAWPYPLWFAHRGAGKLAPENTLAAFRVGASHGYRAFECDVKLSADGVPFLLHDATLQRTANAEGLAGDRLWHELSQLDAGSWYSPAFAGEPLVSLANIARFCIGNHCALNIEIKPTPGHGENTGRVVAAHAQRLWANASLKPLLSSFEPDALAAAQTSAPSLPRALLLDSLRSHWLQDAQALQCAAVVTNYRLMDEALIAEIHGAGMRALVYTVNEPAVAERLIAWKIDGLITDAVDRLSAAQSQPS